MAQETVEVPIVKSSQWRAITATAVVANAIGGPGGLEIILRFWYEWIDVVKDRFQANVTEHAQAKTFTVVAPMTPLHSDLFKIEEMAARLSLEAATSLITVLLIVFSQIREPQKLNEQQKKKIRDAFAQFDKSA